MGWFQKIRALFASLYKQHHSSIFGGLFWGLEAAIYRGLRAALKAEPHHNLGLYVYTTKPHSAFGAVLLGIYRVGTCYLYKPYGLGGICRNL